MGLLDDLRAEADAARGAHAARAKTSEQRIAATEECVKRLVSYWAGLHADLNAIAPKISRRFELERDLILQDLELAQFRVDHRKKYIGEEHVTDYALVIFEQTSTSLPNPLKVKRSSAEYEKTRLRLFEVGIKAEEDILRDADQRMLRAGVRFGFDHDRMVVDIRMKNVEFAGLLYAEFAVEEVTQGFLEDLTKYLIDRASTFPILKFKKAQNS
jgi:hypothetical protein